jgi:hypothetical protein
MGVFIAPCASVQKISLICWNILTCDIGELVMISCVYANWNECGKSSWNIILPFSFLPWIVVLCFGKMLVKSCRTLETNNEMFFMPKLPIVFSMMFLTFLFCNHPTCHLCELSFSCNSLLTISFEHTYHPWCIKEYTELCPIVLFFFVTLSLLQIGVQLGVSN